MARITDIIYHRTEEQNTNNDIEYNIGTTFDQVHVAKDNNFTLAGIVNYLKTFFNKQMHMIYQGAEPQNLKVMEWYAVGGDIETDDAPTAAANN